MKYLLISLFILAIGFVGILNPVRSGVQWVASPIQFGLKNISFYIKDGVSFFTHIARISEMNKDLIRDNMALQTEILELKKVREENTFLKDPIYRYRMYSSL